MIGIAKKLLLFFTKLEKNILEKTKISPPKVIQIFDN